MGLRLGGIGIFGRTAEGSGGNGMLQMHGILDPVGIGGHGALLQQRLVPGHKLTFEVHGLRLHLRQVVDEQNVRQTAGRNGTDLVVHTEMAGGVDRGHLNRLHGRHAQLYGAAHVVVDVALLHDLTGVLVVGAEAEIVGAAAQLQRGADQGVHIALGAALAHQNAHTHPQATEQFFLGDALVVIGNTAGGIYIQLLAQTADGVAVDDLAAGQRVGYLVDVFVLDKQDLGRVQLAQTDGFLPIHDLRHLLSAQSGAVGFQTRRRRHAGGYLDQHTVGQAVDGLQHGAQALLAGHIGNFHQVGTQGGGAVGHDHGGQCLRGEHGGLKVHMRVDQARYGISAAAVHGFQRFQYSARFDGHDPFVLDINVGGIYFAGKYIDQLRIGQSQVAGVFPQAGFNGVFDFFKSTHGCSPYQLFQKPRWTSTISSSTSGTGPSS